MSDSVFQTGPEKSLAEISKEKIMLTAMQLFAKNGFHTTTAATIARACNISHGLLFYHFGSKEGLLQAIVDFSTHKIKGILSTDDLQLQNSLTASKKLEQIVRKFRQSLVEEREFWELYHSLIFQPGLKEETARQLISAFDDHRKFLIHFFEQLGYLSATDTMQQFEAMRSGITMTYLMHGPSYPINRLFQNLIDRFS
ncbi:AcrR family transcriptional regulator [Catalinimonas alkaloidigena]|uniref:TetR/AcrR family transcriptional regulator n=1 Tax=Catalinimonas alkaloidigena TaxID=1075417 RepID=UPI0024059385|nr:TetR/AcrR family transcriptional regulator [Catalinimonas alkaloidigena]MDF9800116.1 AcrR family transcriptional regulator [Catalinimonas alkaloidigena]